MPTYQYETIPDNGDVAEQFELKQGMSEPALTVHPTTGVPVRRVISGGMGLVTRSTDAAQPAGPGCGPETCHCGRFS